jgi:dTDP-4-amino-4,6-dideoxygalactose transaminase
LNLELLNGNLRRTFPRVPLAVPFWNGETYRQLVRCCFSGRIVDGSEIARLKSQIIAALGVDDALLCGSGSLALELALRACEVQPGDEVVLPAFCCSAVVAPVLSLGAVPVLADVGEELNLTVETAAATLTRKTRAIIVPHLFGNPADIEAIVELADARNIRVIDDAAQALGATIDGQPVGSFGDAGVLSFGREKVCFGLGGGVLLCRREVERSRVAGGGMELPRFRAALQNFLSTLVWRRWRRGTAPLSTIRSRQADPGAAPSAYRRELMANLNAAVAASLLGTLGENIAARRKRVQAYRELLGNEPGVELMPHRPGSACLAQVVRVLAKKPKQDAAARLIADLVRCGYEVQGSYMPIHLLEPFEKCVWDALPCTERVWTDLIELPCEPSVSLSDVERITTLVKEFCRDPGTTGFSRSRSTRSTTSG